MTGACSQIEKEGRRSPLSVIVPWDGRVRPRKRVRNKKGVAVTQRWSKKRQTRKLRVKQDYIAGMLSVHDLNDKEKMLPLLEVRQSCGNPSCVLISFFSLTCSLTTVVLLHTDKQMIQRRHAGCCRFPEVASPHIAGNMKVRYQTLYEEKPEIQHTCIFYLVNDVFIGLNCCYLSYLLKDELV